MSCESSGVVATVCSTALKPKSQPLHVGRVNRRAYLALAGAGVAGVAVLGSRSWSDAEPDRTTGASPWPTYRGDAGRTGFAPEASLPASGGDAAWRFDPEYAPAAAPVADADHWYVADSWNVYAADRRTGDRWWRHRVRDRTDFPCINRGAAVATGNEIIIGTCEGVRALDPADGSVLWTRGDVRAGRARPALSERSVYLRGTPRDGATETVYRLDPGDGTIRARARPEANSLRPPAVDDDAVVVAATGDDDGNESGRVYRLGLDGSEQWRRSFAGDPARTTPAVADRTVYVAVGGASSDSRLVALDAGTGEPRWSFGAESRVDHPPALAGATVYVGTAGGWLVALDAESGERRWRYDLGAGAATAPSAAANGVCVTSSDGTLHAVGDDGQQLWTVSLGDAPYYADPVVLDGIVIAGGRRLVALRAD